MDVQLASHVLHIREYVRELIPEPRIDRAGFVRLLYDLFQADTHKPAVVVATLGKLVVLVVATSNGGSVSCWGQSNNSKKEKNRGTKKGKTTKG